MAPYGSETPIALIPTAAVGMGKNMQQVVYGVDRTERIELRSEEFNGRGGIARRGRGGQGRGAMTDNGFNRFGKREFERHSGSDRT